MQPNSTSEPLERPVSPVSGAGQQSNPTWQAQNEQLAAFSGNTAEYFRIWAVNICLTLVTFGLYSSWAKVRNQQYFARHTSIGEHSFDYHGDPLAIFKGRLVMGTFFALLMLSQSYSPVLYLLLILALVVASPWLIVKAMAFHTRNHSYRNVRFSFRGSVSGAYLVSLKGFLAYFFTLGLGLPYWQYTQTEFIVENVQFGDQKFRFKTPIADYFIAFVLMIACYVPAMTVLICSVIGGVFGGGLPNGLGEIIMVGGILLGYALMLLPVAFMKARMANLLYNGMEVGEHTFLESSQVTLELLKLYLVNAVAVVFTFGLATPWVKVRMARYRCETLKVHNANFLVAEVSPDDDVGALGDAASDFGDFGLELG
ncbi:MAG: DUF898 domain-containing protein [Deltaproteobacteria bacterium]|nr:DUF898 domain-containing protein [Deltaproteobacteria bacterium]